MTLRGASRLAVMEPDSPSRGVGHAETTMFRYKAIIGRGPFGAGRHRGCTRLSNPRWLLLGSGVVTGPSRYQAGDEGAEQGFAASARVVHELEEAKIERQLVLRDAAVRAQPGA